MPAWWKKSPRATSFLGQNPRVRVPLLPDALGCQNSRWRGVVRRQVIMAIGSFNEPRASSVGHAFGAFGQKVFAKIEALRQPSIAMIPGFALGGGCELALACDIRIASEKARFGQPEVGLGITAGFGGTQRLPRLVGRGAASLLLFSGNMIDAAEALRIGLVDKIVPHDALAAEVSALAEGIARQARCAVQQTKRCIRHGLESGLESGLSYEAQAFGLCFSTKEQKDRMRAFVNRRR